MSFPYALPVCRTRMHCAKPGLAADRQRPAHRGVPYGQSCVRPQPGARPRSDGERCMSDAVTADRVATLATAARVPLSRDSAARVARSVSPTVARLNDAPVEFPFETEPA